jgi:hypothetical protein
MTPDERFISRWSRLKKEARQTDTKPPESKPDAPSVANQASPVKDSPAPAPAAPELPPIDSLKGLASEYTDFLKPGVDEGLRRAALKKLFKDPYFETFEKFAEYCEDYTQGEPIPPAMLRTLEHAKRLLFDEKEEERMKEEERGAIASAEPRPEVPAQGPIKAETASPPEPREKT